MFNGTRRSIGGLASLLIPLLICGCVDFRQETLLIRFGDGEGGGEAEVTCLLLYEGLHVSSGEEKALERARNQLGDFVSSRQQFCLGGNWIGHIDLAPRPDEEEEAAEVRRAIASHLEIRNGAFLLNGRGELCGYQTVTVRDAEGFVDLLNRLLSGEMERMATEELSEPPDEPADPDRFRLSEASLRKVRGAAQGGHEWIRLTPGRIEFRMPMTPEDAALASEALEAQDDPLLGFEEGDAPRITPTPEGLTIALGDGQGRTIRLRTSRDDGDAHHERELMEFAETLDGVTFDREQDPEALIRAFEKGR